MNHRINGLVVSLTCAALGLLSAAAPAAAQIEERAVRVTVPFSDLDLSRPAGARVLLGRIQRASIEACGGVPPGSEQLRQRPEMAAFDSCRRHAINEAVAAIHSPVLTAMVEGAPKPELLASR